MKLHPELLAALAGLGLSAACTDRGQGPVEVATAAASDAARPGGDATRLAPAQARAGEGTLAAMRKDELAKAWAEASRDVPNLVYALEDRLEILSGAKQLPTGLDASAIAWARQSLALVGSGWSKAQEQFRDGHAAEAVATSQEARALAREILQKVGMP